MPTLLLALAACVLVAVCAGFLVETGFIYVMAVKRLKEQGVEIPDELMVTGYVWLALGTPADAIYNLTRGTWMFRELPRDLMFSGRIQRYIDEGEGWRFRKALPWARLLNAIDPSGEHTKRVPANAP